MVSISPFSLFRFFFVFFLVVSISFFSHNCSAAVGRSKKLTSSVVLPINGDVYPRGYYHATLSVGQPPKTYFLDIDTGSDLTWLQCDAPCAKCTPAPHGLYKPGKNVVTCKDPACESLHWPAKHPCGSVDEQCDYEVDYADNGSSLGVLVQDSFNLKLTNRSIVGPKITFGCGYNQEVPDSLPAPYTDGVLGLGSGKASVLSQLQSQGLIRNVVGHCLSGQGGGFLFFGDDLVPATGIVWTPLLSNSAEKYYSLGPASLAFGGQPTSIKGLSVIFDSGSTYSYFNTQAYNALVSAIKKDVHGKQLQDAVEDNSLPVCWKGPKPFKAVSDVKKHFKPVALVFKNSQFQMQPESYLIVTKRGNACLGILNGSEVGLENSNLIGDISMQDKMIIYDNEKQLIGWAPASCNNTPIVHPPYCEAMQPYGANIGSLEESCPVKAIQ